MQSDIVAFLRSIPQSNEDPQSLATLLPNEMDSGMFLGFALMLQTLGAIELDADQKIRAASQTAKYFLLSLAFYVEQDFRVISDWHTRGVNRDGDHNPLQNGATFLHALEKQRQNMHNHSPASRSVEVAQVLIKRSNPDTGQPELLFQYDANANQYQLIGGRRSDSDESQLHTIIREIEEEIANTLRYEQDYQLACVIEDLRPPITLSPTFGALSEYRFGIYHMSGLTQEIVLQEADLWVPIEDVLRGSVRNKQGISYDFTSRELYVQIEDALDGGLLQLSDSFRG